MTKNFGAFESAIFELTKSECQNELLYLDTRGRGDLIEYVKSVKEHKNNNDKAVLMRFAEWWGVDGHLEGEKLTDVINMFVDDQGT